MLITNFSGVIFLIVSVVNLRILFCSDLNVPFPQWDTDRVALWLHSLGLSMYIGECKRWVQNGDQLLRASGQDLEKVMGCMSLYGQVPLGL